MQTDKDDMKLEQSVSMHLHTLKRSCKRQIVADPKSRNASRMYMHVIIFYTVNNYYVIKIVILNRYMFY